MAVDPEKIVLFGFSDAGFSCERPGDGDPSYPGDNDFLDQAPGVPDQSDGVSGDDESDDLPLPDDDEFVDQEADDN